MLQARLCYLLPFAAQHCKEQLTTTFIYTVFEEIIKMADFFYFFVVDSYFVRFFLL